MAATTLQIKILADATQAAATMDKAATRASKFGSGLRKAALPAAAVIAGLGAMAKAAADDARGQAVLANVLAKTTGATSAQVAATEDFITKTALATGVADDQLRPALASLATATGDVGKSQDAMAVALDVAAATGKDVTTVADAMAKGYGGNIGALKRLVPGLSDAAAKSGDMTKVMDELARKTGGTAAKAADTAAGKMQRAAVAMDEVKESAGAALLPVLDKLGGVLGSIAKFAQKNQGVMTALVVVFGTLAAAVLITNAAMAVYNTIQTISIALQKAYNKQGLLYATVQGVIRVATLAWIGVQLILNAVLTANPIGLVIVAIAALIAIVIIAYKKSQTFRNIVAGAWLGIKVAVAAVWSFLKIVFAALVAAFKAIGSAAGWLWGKIKASWDLIKSGMSAAWSWIRDHVIDPYVAAIKKIADKMAAMRDAVGRIWDAIKDAIGAAIDWIKGKIDGLLDKAQAIIDKLKKIPGVGKVLGAVGMSTATAATAATAPAVRGRGTGRAAPAKDARRSADQPVVINVILDGKRVGGYVDRVISRRLDLEGARAAAGSWA